MDTTLLAACVAREITPRGAFRFIDEIDEAMWLRATGERFDHGVTHRYAVADAAEAMDLAKDPGRASKVVLEL